jgi:hypothetical protein
VEDIQLTFFSWKEDIVGHKYSAIQFIYNPLYYLVEHFLWELYIVAFAIFVVLICSMIYSAQGLYQNRLKAMWPLKLLRILTLLTSTILFVPLLEALLHPLGCETINGASYVSGMETVLCHSSTHTAIYILTAIALVLFVPYGLLMSLLFFQFNPKHLAAKVSGKTDCVYMIGRIGLVAINLFLGPKPSSILTLIIISYITVNYFWNQPFFAPKLNNIRFSLYFSAWVLSIFSIVAAFGGNHDDIGISYIISALMVGIAAIPAGFFINHYSVKFLCSQIYKKFDKESSMGLTQTVINSKSVFDLKDVKMNDVLGIVKVRHEFNVFPSPQWVEISIRFIRKSYLSHRASTYATSLFDAGLKQYNRSALLHLLKLEYIDSYFPGEKDNKTMHLNALKSKCQLSLPEKVPFVLPNS